MTHPLKLWLDETGTPQGELAKRAGISRMHLWRLLNGVGDFSTSTLRAVSEATGNAVSVSQLIEPNGEPEPEAAS